MSKKNGESLKVANYDRLPDPTAYCRWMSLRSGGPVVESWAEVLSSQLVTTYFESCRGRLLFDAIENVVSRSRHYFARLC